MGVSSYLSAEMESNAHGLYYYDDIDAEMYGNYRPRKGCHPEGDCYYDEPYINTCEGTPSSETYPCAPHCGAYCGVTTCTIAATIGIVVGVAIIILQSDESAAMHLHNP